MRGVRNPFRLSTAESIETDADFLRLFGPGVLDLLPEGSTTGQLLFIRSAPGGGKTTLLRVFTPSVLLSLLSLRSSEPHREIFSKLRQMDVVDDSGLRVLGTLLSCRRTFPSLDDLDLPRSRSDRLLRALLDARILLGALRTALEGAQLRYPDDLDRLTLQPLGSGESVPGLELPCSGSTARSWAEGLERMVCDAIDSLGPLDGLEVQGHDMLYSLAMLDASAIQVDSTAPAARWLVLLDDVHKLTNGQRKCLHATLVEGRHPTGVWVAERLEALSTDEVLATGALEARDYDGVVNLEDAWGKGQGRRSFAFAVGTIAERRARMAADVAGGASDVGSFAGALDPGQDPIEHTARTNDAISVVRARLDEVARAHPRYSEWIRTRRTEEGSPREVLLGLRTLEILIERDRRKAQMSLGFELPAADLVQRDASAVRNAAELFLAAEFQLPYYFGSECVANLGFQNVEQFLRLAGDLFEEVLGAALIRRNAVLSPERQEQLLMQSCATRLAELPRRAGRDVLRFLDAVGKYCRYETYRPNAPYAPGVTGIAISMSDRERLLDPTFLRGSDLHRRFADMLAAALSQNIFRAELDRSVKGGRYMVLYLNRIVCLKYRLPMGYGGFREKSLREFIGWMERGFSKKEELAL